MDAWTDLRLRLGELASTAPPAPSGGRLGAALALLREVGDGDLELVLTRRRDDLPVHPGQISFPGGRVDPGETVEAAALREAHEECALRPATATVLGMLPAFYIPPSRFWLQVVAARWDDPHPLHPAEGEVAEILTPRLSALADPERWRVVDLSARGSSWAWVLEGGQILWGATAIATAVLLDALRPGWSRGSAPEDLPADRRVHPWEGAAAGVAVRAAAARGPRLPGVPERPVRAARGGVPAPAAAPAGSAGASAGTSGSGGHPAAPPPSAERAGAVVADAVLQLLGAGVGAAPGAVVVGPGWTGTVGLVAAARLVEAEVEVSVHPARADRPDRPERHDRLERPRRPDRPDAAARRAALERLGAAVGPAGEPGLGAALADAGLVLDAIAGRGLEGAVRAPLRELVLGLAATAAPVVSIDLPSGVDAREGLVGDAVSADVTLALGAPAPGLFAPGMTPFVGDLYLVDVRAEPVEDPLVRLLPDHGGEGWRE